MLRISRRRRMAEEGDTMAIPSSLLLFSSSKIGQCSHNPKSVKAKKFRMEKDKNYNYFCHRCVKLVCVTLFALHLTACFYYHISASYLDPKRTWFGRTIDNFLEQGLWTRYVTSIHWSITTLTTIRYGDLHVENSREMIFCIFYMLFNLGFTSYLIANMTNLVVNGTSRTKKIDLVVLENGVECIVGETERGDLCGMISYKSQHFIVRTNQLSQVLRLNHTTFLNIIQPNVGNETTIMNNLLQHLKEYNDPIMIGILTEIENMIAAGRMDLPLSLCFAAVREDNFLLCQLLKRCLNPNESNNNGKTTLHIAACKGKEKCVSLPLENGVDTNLRDFDGNVPLWEAIPGGHESVSSVIVENGANLKYGDIGQYAKNAVEQNNLNLLKDEMQHYGGDITLPNDVTGSTTLHTTLSEDNVEIVEFPLEHVATIDKLSMHGSSPSPYKLQFPLSEDPFEDDDSSLSDVKSYSQMVFEEGSFPMSPQDRYKVVEEVHTLRIYRRILEAFLDSGPLTKEKFEVMRNIRISLHLSVDDFFLVILDISFTRKSFPEWII